MGAIPPEVEAKVEGGSEKRQPEHATGFFRPGQAERRKMRIRAKNGFTSRGGALVFAPGWHARAVPSGPDQTNLRYESSFFPRLRQAPSRRLPSGETQGHGVRDLQIEPEIQGPPRRDDRHPSREKGPLRTLARRAASSQIFCSSGLRAAFFMPVGRGARARARRRSGRSWR